MHGEIEVDQVNIILIVPILEIGQLKNRVLDEQHKFKTKTAFFWRLSILQLLLDLLKIEILNLLENFWLTSFKSVT